MPNESRWINYIRRKAVVKIHHFWWITFVVEPFRCRRRIRFVGLKLRQVIALHMDWPLACLNIRPKERRFSKKVVIRVTPPGWDKIPSFVTTKNWGSPNHGWQMFTIYKYLLHEWICHICIILKLLSVTGRCCCCYRPFRKGGGLCTFGQSKFDQPDLISWVDKPNNQAHSTSQTHQV